LLDNIFFVHTPDNKLLLKYYIIFMVERILSRMHEVKMELNTYNQSSAFDISIFILIIKGINLRLIKEVIRRLDIKRIAKKIKDDDI